MVEEFRDSQPFPPSVRAIARQAGISESTFANWQHISGLPEREHLEAFARISKCSYQELLWAALMDAGYAGVSDDPPTKQAGRAGQKNRPDIVFHTPDGEVAFVLEVKSGPMVGKTAQTASALLGLLELHGGGWVNWDGHVFNEDQLAERAVAADPGQSQFDLAARNVGRKSQGQQARELQDQDSQK